MDRKRFKKFLPIIQAFSEGKIIEQCSKTDVGHRWQDVGEFLNIQSD